MPDIKKIKLGNTTYDIVDGVHKNVIILEDNSSTAAGTWLGKTDRISAYEDGQVFLYKVPIAGVSGGTTLNINDLGPKNIYRGGTTKLTTHYEAGSYVLLYYSASLNSGSFRLVNDYATDNDKKTASGNTNSKIYLIGATSQSSSGQTTYSHDTVYVDTDGHLYCNGKKVSHVGHTHEITTEDAAPQGHLHTVTVNGTTGTNSGTAVTALTGVKVSSSTSAAPGGHTHPYDKTTGITLTSTEVATDRSTTYVESISGSKPSLGGTKTFVTGVNGGSGSLTSDTTSTNGIKYVESISGGSGSLVAYNAATEGAVTVENGKRIPVVTTVTHTGASVKSTANAAPHTHTHNVTVSGTTGANSGTAVAAVTGVGANGTATVLTGVKASSTATFLQTVAEGSGSLVAYDVSTEGSAVYPNEDTARIPVVTSLSKAGYTPAGTVSLTPGTAPSMNFNTGSSSDTSYISGLTKSGYTPAGTVSLTPGTAPSMGSATTKYLSASASGTAVGAKGTGSVAPSGHTHTVTVSGTTGANSGTAVKAVTGYSSFSGGSLTGTKTFNTDAIKSVGGTRNYGFSTSTSNVMHTPTVSNGVLSWSVADASTQDAHTGTAASTGTVGFTAASLGTASTSDVAPAAHTHSYGSSTALTTSGNSGTAITALTGVKVTTQPTITLTANTSNATGRIKYVEAQGTFTAGTTPKSSASFSGTATTALVTSGTTKYMKFSAGTTPKSSASFTGTESTAVVTSGTVVHLEHTHTATTEGTTASAVTAVAANGTATALTGVKATSTANVAPSGHTHSYGSSTALTTGNNSGSAVAAVTAINGGSISPTTYYIAHSHTGADSTTKYLHHTHTEASSSGTGTVSISGGEYTATTKYLSASPTHTATASLANSGTNFNAATAVAANGTATVAPSGHTHSYGSSTAINTSANSGSAVAAVTEVKPD